MYTIVLCGSLCMLCWSLGACKASTWMMIWFPTFIFYFFCVRLLLNTQRPPKHRRIKTQLLFRARFNCAAPAAADEMKLTRYYAHPCPHAEFMRLATYPRLEIINPTVFSSTSWIYRLVAPTSLLVRMMRINKNIIQSCAAPAAAAGRREKIITLFQPTRDERASKSNEFLLHMWSWLPNTMVNRARVNRPLLILSELARSRKRKIPLPAASPGTEQHVLQ